VGPEFLAVGQGEGEETGSSELDRGEAILPGNELRPITQPDEADQPIAVTLKDVKLMFSNLNPDGRKVPGPTNFGIDLEEKNHRTTHSP
jgi:hypothetical protein